MLTNPALLPVVGAVVFDGIFATDGLAENCEVYMAPSKIGGWGVYAGRDFEDGEIVELSPRFLTMKNDFLDMNVLDDYHYGFTFHLDPSDTSFGVVTFGMAMWFNHGPGEKQNVVYTSFGREPDKDMAWAAEGLGYVANRFIKRGEELLSSYGDTDQWFTDRGLVMMEQPEKKLPSLEEMQLLERKYCSNLVAGIGHSAWNHRIAPSQMQTGYPMPQMDLDARLPLQDHPTAIAKKGIVEGETLETAPALVVPMEHMIGSVLSPMVIYWHDLDERQKETIHALREIGAFRMKGINNETGHHEIDVLKFFDDASILPAAGGIALVKKVGNDNPNCRIDILASTEQEEDMDMGSTGLVLKLVATKNIQSGEELRLDLPDSSSWDSKMSLQQHLALSGQPIPRHIVDTYNPATQEFEDEDEEEPEF